MTLFLLYLYSVFKVHPDFFKPVSGDNEIRTRDPLLARQVLSQAVAHQVPSTAWVLTVVFGMGTGVSPKRIITEDVLCVSYFV